MPKRLFQPFSRNSLFFRASLGLLSFVGGTWISAKYFFVPGGGASLDPAPVITALDVEMNFRRFLSDVASPLHQPGSRQSEKLSGEAEALNRQIDSWLANYPAANLHSPGLFRDVTDLSKAAKVFLPALDEQDRTDSAIRQNLAQLTALDALVEKSAANPGQTGVSELSSALSKILAQEALLLGGNREISPSTLQPHIDAAHLAASAKLQHDGLAREKAALAEMEKIVVAIPAQITALQSSRQLAASASRRLASAEAQLHRELARLTATPKTNPPSSLEIFYFALADAGLALLILAFVRRGREKLPENPEAHLLSVIRTVLVGNPKTRAQIEKSGQLRDLAAALNEMIAAFQEAEKRSQLANDSLDLKIHARTAELWRANKALREESEQRAKAEHEFQQAQKMDALGKLAGSIAHDFNNLLTIIIGSAECARQRLGYNHQASSMLHTAEQAAERAAALTRPLLAFSRSQVIPLGPVDLNEAAKEASAMLQRLIGINIEVKLHLQPQLRKIRANGNQLQQVLVNLGVNARDAMNGNGLLTITTRESMNERVGENWIELAVGDSGCGMDAATKARIFEPFFTTKPVGKGTGLGLSTVFGIVKQCGGLLDVDSQPGEGATFRVLFPPASSEELAAAIEDCPRQKLTSIRPVGDVTILLVDDEDDIRELATLTLESRGYKVLGAADAEAALQIVDRHGPELSALVTDVIMPGMSGLELAEVVAQKLPNLRILFVSGHSSEALNSSAHSRDHVEFLQKPYRSDDLAAKVDQVINRRASAADHCLI